MEIALAIISALTQLIPEATTAYPIIAKLIGGTSLTADEVEQLNVVRRNLEAQVAADAAAVEDQPNS